ncbi:ABC transporter permease [Paenibacillus baekrokdamisoli]|uniref:ABC transporter permease n=1 Tax=Paenibacillus baekrokdamisoli TaxID=1712516 RepID=A0A3G9J8J4_9BACL|nr:ABC-2 family transporter protein [Paenibacillus baekrokdamisoli]MBB3070176.1 ABC-2 type transport system permease protein [Paenibacillus baekrokdamisoli]BBH21183.1 ABC transporter permease [Paenibacillus baekrokdamisoli]
MSTVARGNKRKAGHSALGTIQFLLTCWKVNLASIMEYRISFLLMAGMMFINNFMWLFFWSLFFHRFSIVNNWELHDVMMLWAIGAGGFGWANVLFGNFHRIATIVAGGQLDVYLSQPKPVLLNVMASRMSLTAVGDFIFGLVVYAWVGDHSLTGALLFILSLLISGALFMAIMIIAGCCAFFIGNAEGISQQIFNGFLALTTYPTDIFRGIARLLLFTVVPAGFISYLPIGLLKDFDLLFALGAIGFTGLLGFIGVLLFHAGLRRYTSGNTLAMRS